MAIVRNIALAGFAAVMVWGVAQQARAQEIVPELDGGPGSHPAKAKQDLTTKQATKHAQAAADKVKTDRAKLTQQASAQDTEQARLAKRADDLKAQQARLDARASDLAARETRLMQLRADQEADQAARLAEISRQREAVEQQTAALRAEQKAALQAQLKVQEKAPTQAAQTPTADAAPPPRSRNRLESRSSEVEPAPDDQVAEAAPDAPRTLDARLDLDAARQSCSRAGETAALARRYYSAQYDDAVRVYQDRGWKLRGHMRLEGRRGDLLIDTICDVDADGEAQHFAFVRSSAATD